MTVTKNIVSRRQKLTCAGKGHDPDGACWTDEWTEFAECRNGGWWAKLTPGEGWQPCNENGSAVAADLNRWVFFQRHGFDGLYEVCKV